jgi:hypothetical protein
MIGFDDKRIVHRNYCKMWKELPGIHGNDYVTNSVYGLKLLLLVSTRKS